MEELVGAAWHRLITRAARDTYPDAGVSLAEIAPTLGIFFRALGGDGGLRVEAGEATEHAARRGWLQRIAGSGRKLQFAWRDEQSLRVPGRIEYFPQRELNRDLYLWLGALAAGDRGAAESWIRRNQRLTRETLTRYPGLARRYRRLVAAHLARRPDPARLPADEAAQERALRMALEEPGAVPQLPVARRAPHPVPLWLHPSPPGRSPGRAAEQSQDRSAGGESRDLKQGGRRQAERVAMPESDRGLVALRMENIFGWGEFVNLDRGSEDNEDLEQARSLANDMERLAVSRDARSPAKRLRFDLDLPSEACDDRVLGEGTRLPEWDWKSQALIAEQCRILPLEAADAPPCTLPPHLRPTARRLRAQFEQLRPARIWRPGQTDGAEIDLEAYLRFRADQAAGLRCAGDALYRDLRPGARDLACLLLADLSLSTDTWVDDQQRVIDVIRDSLFLFAESLAATGDRFALYGFSSRKRDPVRVHRIKDFDQGYDAVVRGRIQGIKPGYYTRMGAAVRHACNLLGREPAEQRLLLLLTDGKPNDLDRYEGRYGIEDTRHAVRAARGAGLRPFCVTVDRRGSDYLPYLFGSGGFVVIRRPQELPRKLPLLYAQLTR